MRLCRDATLRTHKNIADNPSDRTFDVLMSGKYLSCMVVSLMLLSGICHAQATEAICKSFGKAFADDTAHAPRQKELLAFEQQVCGCLISRPAKTSRPNCNAPIKSSSADASLILADLTREWPRRDGAGGFTLSDEILFVLAAEPSTVSSFVGSGETYKSWLRKGPSLSFTDFGGDAKLLEQARKDTIRSLKSQAAAHELVKVLEATRVRVIQ
jgi:hypothetical protein